MVDNELLTTEQAAEMLTITPGTLTVWRSTGRYVIPYIKIGKNVRYRRSDLMLWIASRVNENGKTNGTK